MLSFSNGCLLSFFPFQLCRVKLEHQDLGDLRENKDRRLLLPVTCFFNRLHAFTLTAFESFREMLEVQDCLEFKENLEKRSGGLFFFPLL